MDDLPDLVSTSNATEELPVYNFLTVGNEAEKIKYIVLQHVENSSFKKLFGPLCKVDRNMDELSCAEACTILKALKGEPEALEVCCNAMVSLLSTEEKCLLPLDRIITKIILTAYEEGIISLLLACQLLVSSVDFKTKIPLDPKKIIFVRERMHQLDYKCMRDLLKLLLVEKLDKMQCVLTEDQHNQLIPVEELMIDLIDRKKNFCPALFFITEISRIAPNSSVHFLPRVSLKIREMVASFRPLAEIGSMIGRSWMYPITTQASFAWALSTWSTWKLQESTYRLHFKTHLPYSNENMDPQTYLQYILLKQPRGQENLFYMLRATNHGIPRIQCNEVIQALIIEALCAIEDSELPVSAAANQYNCFHLCHLVTYSLFLNFCTLQHSDAKKTSLLQQLLSSLQSQLKLCPYNKAKGELMWILLQYIALSKPKLNQTGSFKNQLDSKNRDLVLEIFNTLYPDEMVWAGCSTDTLNMVRFFAPAAIWINLSINYFGASNIAIPPKVQQHIEFLQKQLESGNVLENGVLAVIANAYSNNAEVFEAHVSRAILKLLGANLEQSSPAMLNQQQSSWILPHGRKADGCLAALDLSLLDSMTFHAKRTLYHSLFNYLQIYTMNDHLPSPALVETCARILLTTEMSDKQESNGRVFVGPFLNLLRVPLDQKNPDLIAISADLLNYRLQNAQIAYHHRSTLLFLVFETLCHYSLISGSQALALHSICEQIIMRQMTIASPLDFISLSLSMISNKSNNVPPYLNLFLPPENYGHVDYGQVGVHACPEITRMYLLNLCRAHKIIASSSNYIINEFQMDYTPLLRQIYKWPSSAIKWFPSVLQNLEVDNGPDERLIRNLRSMSDREQQAFLHDSEGCFQNSVTILITIFRCIYEYSNFPTLSYKVLAQMNARDLILNINAFVDYIIWNSKVLENEQYDGLLNVVNEMVFAHNCIPIERFLLAIVLHPNDDQSIQLALLLLGTLIKKFPHFTQRIHNYCSFAPLYSNYSNTKSEDFFNKLADYYKKYPEFTYLEMYRRTISAEKFAEPPNEKHLPIYYDVMPERIWPIVDVLLQRSLEISINPQILSSFLTTFSPLYKLHPQPITFLYKTMYSLDSLETFSHTTPSRQFVVEIVQKIDDDRNPKYPVVSQEFVVGEHKMPIMRICQVLVDRIIEASTYVHQPPSFVLRDWRFAEYPPAAQALTGAWIELMASPYPAEEITEGLVQLAMRRPIAQPYDTINALGLLLTGLPHSFQNVFFNKIVDSFDWPQVVQGQPSMLFESFSQEVYLYSESRILSMLALIHAFCQHAGNNSLSVLPDLIADSLAPKVQNETQLMYFLRILVPYLQRISDKEKMRHMNEYLKLIISIYNVLGTLVEKIGQLKYEDTVCDLLYQFKYMFVGYSLKNEAEQAIEKFPESMREKLKFLLTHSSTAETSFQQQQQHQQNNSMGHQQPAQQQQPPFAGNQPNMHILQQLAGGTGGMQHHASGQLQEEQQNGIIRDGPYEGHMFQQQQHMMQHAQNPMSLSNSSNRYSSGSTPGSQPSSSNPANQLPPPPPYSQQTQMGSFAGMPGMGQQPPPGMLNPNFVGQMMAPHHHGPMGSMPPHSNPHFHPANQFPGSNTFGVVVTSGGMPLPMGHPGMGAMGIGMRGQSQIPPHMDQLAASNMHAYHQEQHFRQQQQIKMQQQHQQNSMNGSGYGGGMSG